MAPRTDWTRLRGVTDDTPEESVSLGMVGHSDLTPSYARLEDGRVLVEVTLQPSGEEVVAQCPPDLLVSPVRYGERVVVLQPGGSAPVVVARLTTQDEPWPGGITGVDLAPGAQGAMPAYGVLRLQDGELLGVQTGADGDVVVQSGAGIHLRVDSADQILLSGRTHLGQSAQWSSAPVGAAVGDDGETLEGQAAGLYTPAPNTNVTTPPPADAQGPLPADGILRIKDTVQTNAQVDPEWWAWLQGFLAVFAGWVPVPNDGGAALKTALSSFFLLNPTPTTITSQPASGSRNTCSDG